MHFNSEYIRKFYAELPQKMELLRQKIATPLTLTEKLLYLHPTFDLIMLHEASAQLPLLQFASSGKNRPAIPTTIFCDHLIVAENGTQPDLEEAYKEHGEIFDFLRNASVKYSLDFWKPDSGIGQQLISEHYAFPGGMLLASDFHSATAGSLAMLAFEGSGADALDAMVGLTKETARPKIIGIHLKGKLQGWATAKDLILQLLPILATKDTRGASLEYFGEGTETLSCSSKGTICSMSGEVGALSSIFPYDDSMADFLSAMGRKEVATFAAEVKQHLQADPSVLKEPHQYYDQVFEIDLSTIEPSICGPFSTIHPFILPEFACRQDYPEKLSAALIGSSTNSSYEDLMRAACVARQALKHGLKLKTPLYISVGSQQIYSTLVREGFWKILEDIGAVLLVNGCGPCIGQWKRNDVHFGERNSIITSFNHNGLGCYDANPGTHAFIASPELVIAFAFAGTLAFNPLEETLMNPQGLPVRLLCNPHESLPSKGFEPLQDDFAPPRIQENTFLHPLFNASSERLQAIEPFSAPLEKTFSDLRPLLKVTGRCTVDQISPGGKWLKFRGHLESISNNLFSHVPNGFREELGKGKNLLNGGIESFAKVAKDYKKEEIGWIVIGHDHYGEGSSNEYAALSMRHLGGTTVIAKSIAPQYELNLKKQGILALTFVRGDDGDKIREDDLIDLLKIDQFTVDTFPELLLKHADGTTERLPLNHSYNAQQLAWFKAGSALNAISDQRPSVLQ